MIEIKTKIVREDSHFEYGNTFHRDSPDGKYECVGNFMRSKTQSWFTKDPHQVWPFEKRRAQDLANLFDGNISCFYYVAALSMHPSRIPGEMAARGICRADSVHKGVKEKKLDSVVDACWHDYLEPVWESYTQWCAINPPVIDKTVDEALKWLMGATAAHINEKGLSFKNINQIMPADYLRTFSEYLLTAKFDRVFMKEIFTVLLDHGEQYRIEEDDANHRLTGLEMMDTIIADPRFKAADSSEIDTIIETVIAANPDNMAKIATNPKLAQWFVGQVMKAARGKASATIVQEKIKAQFGL